MTGMADPGGVNRTHVRFDSDVDLDNVREVLLGVYEVTHGHPPAAVRNLSTADIAEQIKSTVRGAQLQLGTVLGYSQPERSLLGAWVDQACRGLEAAWKRGAELQGKAAELAGIDNDLDVMLEQMGITDGEILCSTPGVKLAAVAGAIKALQQRTDAVTLAENKLQEHRPEELTGLLEELAPGYAPPRQAVIRLEKGGGLTVHGAGSSAKVLTDGDSLTWDGRPITIGDNPPAVEETTLDEHTAEMRLQAMRTAQSMVQFSDRMDGRSPAERVSATVAAYRTLARELGVSPDGS